MQNATRNRNLSGKRIFHHFSLLQGLPFWYPIYAAAGTHDLKGIMALVIG